MRLYRFICGMGKGKKRTTSNTRSRMFQWHNVPPPPPSLTVLLDVWCDCNPFPCCLPNTICRPRSTFSPLLWVVTGSVCLLSIAVALFLLRPSGESQDSSPPTPQEQIACAGSPHGNACGNTLVHTEILASRTCLWMSSAPCAPHVVSDSTLRQPPHDM